MKEMVDVPLSYIPMSKVCQMFGYAQTRSGQTYMRRIIVERVRRAKGKLDKWDPRFGLRGKRKHFYVTPMTLKMLFPEKFDKANELVRHLEKRLREFDARFEELQDQIVSEKKASQKRDLILREAIEKLATIVEEVRTRKASAA